MNMNLQTLISHFNQPDVHLVVSAWPERQNSKEGYHGDAAYTKETLLTLVKRHNIRFVVIAETNHDNKPQLAANGNILILRVIDHGKFRLYPTILTWLAKFPAIRQVTVHSNFTYSGIKHFVLLIPFLALIKLTGRTVTHVAHNVVDSLDFLSRQLNFNHPALVAVMNSGVKIYNTLLGAIVDHLIVLDIQGQKILQKYVSSKKLVSSPHWVKPRTTHRSKEAARKALGIPERATVILSFGFISWYKGSDILARMFANAGKGVHLIFAGGQAPSMAHTPHYRTFYQKFEKQIMEDSNMTLTGFIPDQTVGMYFAAADLVVLPYRGLMGGSGAWAYAVGYKKPFLVSTPMKGMLENQDIVDALTEMRLGKHQILFDLNRKGMQKILDTAADKKALQKLTGLSVALRKSRNIETMTDGLYNEVYTDKEVSRSFAPTVYAPNPVPNQ